MSHNSNHVHFSIMLPVRHNDTQSTKHKVAGLLIFAAFGMVLFGVITLFGPPTTTVTIIVSAMLVLVLGGLASLYFGFRLLRPRYCKICNLRGIAVSKYCSECTPVLLKMLQSHMGPLVCRLCDNELSDYECYANHFRRIHNDGNKPNRDPMVGGKYYKRYYVQDQVFRKIV